MKRIITLLFGSYLLFFAASTCFAQMYTVTDLGTLDSLQGTSTVSGLGCFPTGINSSGQVAGYCNVAFLPPFFGAFHAFRTAPNSPINPATDDLGTLGGSFSYAMGINSSGQVAGFSLIAGDTAWHSFRTPANRPIDPSDDIGLLSGASSCRASAINDLGQVVGYCDSINGEHAFRTAANSSINPADDLGTLGGPVSDANGLDSYGQVVGVSSTSADAWPWHAFIYSNGAMHDLNNLIPVGPGWELWTSTGVNDAGQIVGSAYAPDTPWPPHCVRLDPIYKALVQPPINADGSSVFSAKRGVVPVKFAVTQYGTQPSCSLPATIGIVKAGNGTLASVDESTYSMSADSDSNFRIKGCQYMYNLAASALGVGTYRVDISINGIMVGHAVFALK